MQTPLLTAALTLSTLHACTAMLPVNPSSMKAATGAPLSREVRYNRAGDYHTQRANQHATKQGNEVAARDNLAHVKQQQKPHIEAALTEYHAAAKDQVKLMDGVLGARPKNMKEGQLDAMIEKERAHHETVTIPALEKHQAARAPIREAEFGVKDGRRVDREMKAKELKQRKWAGNAYQKAEEARPKKGPYDNIFGGSDHGPGTGGPAVP